MTKAFMYCIRFRKFELFVASQGYINLPSCARAPTATFSQRPIYLKVTPGCNIFYDITNRLVAAMENIQKWSDHEEIIEKPTTMTEDKERKQKEYRARKLQHLFENAEKAVENYKQLLEKKRNDTGNSKYDKETWTLGLTDRKK